MNLRGLAFFGSTNSVQIKEMRPSNSLLPSFSAFLGILHLS